MLSGYQTHAIIKEDYHLYSISWIQHSIDLGLDFESDILVKQVSIHIYGEDGMQASKTKQLLKKNNKKNMHVFRSHCMTDFAFFQEWIHPAVYSDTWCCGHILGGLWQLNVSPFQVCNSQKPKLCEPCWN